MIFSMKAIISGTYSLTRVNTVGGNIFTQTDDDEMFC